MDFSLIRNITLQELTRPQITYHKLDYIQTYYYDVKKNKTKNKMTMLYKISIKYRIVV